MTAQHLKPLTLSISHSLKVVGIIGGTWAILVNLAATLAYLPGHPDFSIFNTYLSDMGDTSGWSQIFFNSGTLIAVPIRYLVLVLLVLRLMQLGAGKSFAIAALTVGFLSTTGTALMTATPFSVSPIIHKAGIGLYFLGVVVLQAIIFIKEWSLKDVPKILPILSVVMVVLYLVFFTLIMLYEQGVVNRSTPVIWEWLAILSSIVWTMAQSILLGIGD
jgi:flagellar biosynthesis protein FliQ